MTPYLIVNMGNIPVAQLWIGEYCTMPWQMMLDYFLNKLDIPPGNYALVQKEAYDEYMANNSTD